MNGPVPRPDFPPPGALARCNTSLSCIPYGTKRVAYSFDFLCCDGDPLVSGYIAAHVANPAFSAIWFGDPFVAFFIAFLFEAFEVTMLLVFGDFGIFSTTDLSLETWASSVFGDALVNGGLGAIIGWLLLETWHVQGPLKSLRLMPTFWMKLKYALLWVLASAAFIPISLGGVAGTLLSLAAQAASLTIIALATRSRVDNLFVWKWRMKRGEARRCGRRTYWLERIVSVCDVPEARRVGLFLSLFAISALLAMQTSGILMWAPNDWYQVWAASAFVIAVLLVSRGAAKAKNKK